MINAFSLALMLLSSLGLPGLFLVYTLARGSIRIRSEGENVRLDARDPLPMALFAAFLCIALPFVALGSTRTTLCCAALGLWLWLGFRVRVRVSASAVHVRRTFAFVIPWRARTYHQRPRAFTDGWGDELDPEALWLDFGDEKSRIELAWGDASSAGRNDELAGSFNDAVRALGSWQPQPF